MTAPGKNRRTTQDKPCKAKQRRGAPCRRDALIGLDYCRVHARDAGVLNGWSASVEQQKERARCLKA